MTGYTLLAARVILAVVFLIAGVSKLFDHAGARKALREFGVPEVLTGTLGVLLPLGELAVFALLLTADLAWQGGWAALILLSLFLIAMGVAMIRGRQPDCHCFGQIHSEPVGWKAIVRNVVLAGLAGWVVAAGPGHSGADVWAWLASLSGRQMVEAVAACLAGLFFLRVLRSVRTPAAVEAEPEVPEVEDEPEPEVRPQVQRPVARRPAPRPAPASPPVETKTSGGNGLPMGTSAPDFELPDLGGARHSLRSLLEGEPQIVLMFVSPYCKPCMTATANLSKWVKQLEGLPKIVLITRGPVEENAAKLKGCPAAHVLVQKVNEVADAYDCTMTPNAIVLGADGTIRTAPAIGGPAIWELLSSCAKARSPA